MRTASVAVLCLVTVGCVLLSSGCGETTGTEALDTAAGPSGGIERDFAPVILLDAEEPWRPMSARWFIERSVLWFAEDDGCADRKVAIGHAFPEQRSEDISEINWIFLIGLGEGGAAYFRNPYDAECEVEFEVRYRADQLTRPQDESHERRAGLRPGEGFYMDLGDASRRGPATMGATPTYWELKHEGDGQARLTYWLLFGASDPVPDRPGTGHEGDWERVDVLLAHDGEDGYQPRAVQLDAETEEPRDIPWDAFARGDGHPLVLSAPGSHTLTPLAPGATCANCVQWRTWETGRAAAKQRWYGYGGAWGEPGPTAATTGPLGPHRYWGRDPYDPDEGQRSR